MINVVSRVLLLALFPALLLAGCGQKGPLFRPGEAPESQTQGPFGEDASQPGRAEQQSDSAGVRDTGESP